MRHHEKKRGGRTLFFFVYLVFALYLVNFGLNYIILPRFFETINQWVILIGGILLFFSSFSLLKPKRGRH